MPQRDDPEQFGGEAIEIAPGFLWDDIRLYLMKPTRRVQVTIRVRVTDEIEIGECRQNLCSRLMLEQAACRAH